MSNYGGNPMDFEPRLVVDKDAIYVAHDDGYIRKWNLVGEMADDFDPIPVSGSGL